MDESCWDRSKQPKAYHANQILWTTLLFGFVPGCYLFWRNFKTFHQQQAARTTMTLGASLFLVLPIVLALLPPLPYLASAINGAAAAGLYYATKNHQTENYREFVAHNGQTAGWGGVLWVGFIGLVAHLFYAIFISILIAFLSAFLKIPM